jgi:hypothetical protein
MYKCGYSIVWDQGRALRVGLRQWGGEKEEFADSAIAEAGGKRALRCTERLSYFT